MMIQIVRRAKGSKGYAKTISILFSVHLNADLKTFFDNKAAKLDKAVCLCRCYIFESVLLIQYSK
jgi:hypothetical protein